MGYNLVEALEAEAELDTAFMNGKAAKIVWLIVLQDMEHPQPPNRVYCDNETETGIENDTVKNIAHL